MAKSLERSGGKEEMKRRKSAIGRLGVTAVALTLVTTCLMGSTLAKYATDYTGTGTAVAAKWDVSMKADANTDIAATTERSSDFTFTLADTRTGNADLVTADTIAPGSTGAVALQINVKSTNEVLTGAKYEIDTTSLNGLPIKFYKDENFTNEITFTSNKATIESANAIAPKTSGQLDQVIYWKWVTATDSADTTIGSKAAAADRTGTFKINMIAEQRLTK